MWSSCFERLGDGKYGLFFSQKVDEKMIFTWSFWAFHDIVGLGKYGFSRSVCAAIYVTDEYKFVVITFVKESTKTSEKIKLMDF